MAQSRARALLGAGDPVDGGQSDAEATVEMKAEDTKRKSPAGPVRTSSTLAPSADPTVADHTEPKLPDIEICSVGERALLYSRCSGALVYSNDIGLATFEYLRTGFGFEGLIERISRAENASRIEAISLFEATIESWGQAGLLDATPQPFADVLPHRVPQSNAGHSYYSLGERCVVIRSESRRISQQVEAILSPYRSARPAQSVAIVDVLAVENQFMVFCDRVPTWRLANEDEARYLIIRECIEALCDPIEVAAIFHAGCAFINGKGVLLAGETGHGKSTLTLGLVEAGCTYVADDMVALHRDGMSAIALPLVAGLKAGSLDLPAIRRLLSRALGGSPSPRPDVTYLLPDDCAVAGSRIQVNAIILPEYKARGQLSVEKVAPEDALAQILTSGTELSRRSRTIKPLARLLNQVPSYSLKFSDLEGARQVCLRLLGHHSD